MSSSISAHLQFRLASMVKHQRTGKAILRGGEEVPPKGNPVPGPDAAPNAGAEAAPNAGVDCASNACMAPKAGAEPEAAPNTGADPWVAPKAGTELAPKAGTELAPNAGAEVAPNPVRPDPKAGAAVDCGLL